MYEHVKTGCKHIPPSEQTLQFQSEYYLNKPRILSFLSISVCRCVHKNNFCLSSVVANLEPAFRITLGCHSVYVSILKPVLLFMCRIEEAAPILTDGSTHIKIRSGTPQTSIGNRNGFVSTDELHQRSKKTSQGLLPQVNAPTSERLLKPRSVPNSQLHFLLIFCIDRIRH